jgi:hypothetical protein
VNSSLNLLIVEKTFNKPSLCIVMLVAEKRRRKKPREKLKNYENKATCLFIHVWCRIIRMTLPSGHHYRIHSYTLPRLLSPFILIFRLKIEIKVDSAFHAIWLVAQLRISFWYSRLDKNKMASCSFQLQKEKYLH